MSGLPNPYEVMPVIRAMARSRSERQPPCDTPNCPIKRAIFIIESYTDEPYIMQCLNQGKASMDVARHTLAEWERWNGPHCYSISNICYNCLSGRIESLSNGAHGSDLLNRLRDAKEGESLLTCVLFREENAPGRFTFCHAADIAGCIREVKVALHLR